MLPTHTDESLSAPSENSNKTQSDYLTLMTPTNDEYRTLSKSYTDTSDAQTVEENYSDAISSMLKAIECMEEIMVMTIDEQNQQRRDLANLYRNLAHLYEKNKNLDKASSVYQEAIEYLESIINPWDIDNFILNTIKKEHWKTAQTRLSNRNALLQSQ